MHYEEHDRNCHHPTTPGPSGIVATAKKIIKICAAHFFKGSSPSLS